MPIIRTIKWTPSYDDFKWLNAINRSNHDGPIDIRYQAGDVFFEEVILVDINSVTYVQEHRRTTDIVREIERENYVKIFGR